MSDGMGYPVGKVNFMSARWRALRVVPGTRKKLANSWAAANCKGDAATRRRRVVAFFGIAVSIGSAGMMEGAHTGRRCVSPVIFTVIFSVEKILGRVNSA